MSDEPIQVSYSNDFGKLVEVLSQVRRPGDFFATGRKEASMPQLSIEGVGRISFPLLPIQAKEIITQSAEKAPYGKGKETIIDEDIRKVWQIAPEKVTIEGKGWNETFHRLIKDITEALGCQDTEVSAEFYKLLIYETGGFFVAHRDSEKASGMFGTLVVALPSEHEGGMLLVRHAGKEIQIDLRGSDTEEIAYAAFYADCEHEVHPITSGYRVCLIYNLVQKVSQEKAKLTTPDYREAITASANLLKEWIEREARMGEEPPPKKIVYLLEHHYTEAGLSFSSLKNSDAALAKVLREAAEQADCAFHLGQVHIEELGTAEYGGGYRPRYRRSYYDDDDEHDPDYGFGEVYDSSCTIDNWHDINDQKVHFGEMPLGDNELLPPDALDDEKPDEVHFSEATGNAGAEFERTYLRAALVLWPNKNFDQVCLSAGIDAGLGYLGKLVSSLKDLDKEVLKIITKKVEKLTQFIIEEWKSDHRNERRLAQLSNYLVAVNDVTIFKMILPLVLKEYHPSQNKALAIGLVSLDKLDHNCSQEFLLSLIREYGSNHFVYCLDLWLTLANGLQASSVLLKGSAIALIEQMQGKDKTLSTLICSYTEGEKAKKHSLSLTFSMIENFLIFLDRLKFDSLVSDTIKGMMANTSRFTHENILLPWLELRFAKEHADFIEINASHNLLGDVWSQTSIHYLTRSEHPPEPPKDWAQPVTLSCTCEDCLELMRFAHNPILQEYRFRVRQNRRQHLASQIKNRKLDMKATTDSTGSPKPMICTKTRVVYERVYKQYQNDMADMHRLIELSKLGCPIEKKLLERLQKAVEENKFSCPLNS